ncbi:hypothetical protein E5288_WYG006879 [Bos mutus]|uniref:Uncharacterized protein n=1 Tax=Bos mutus TaxID=72004 RepID=A0A6B0QVY3_9CETA|nr:hypothetical protein [Bos mutus]
MDYKSNTAAVGNNSAILSREPECIPRDQYIIIHTNNEKCKSFQHKQNSPQGSDFFTFPTEGISLPISEKHDLLTAPREDAAAGDQVRANLGSAQRIQPGFGREPHERASHD